MNRKVILRCSLVSLLFAIPAPLLVALFVTLFGGAITDMAPHRCPHETDAPTGATAAGITPALTVNCNDGPGGRCVPSQGGAGTGYYEIDLWGDNNVWNGLNFQQEQGHYFHYNFIASNADSASGEAREPREVDAIVKQRLVQLGCSPHALDPLGNGAHWPARARRSGRGIKCPVRPGRG